MEESKAEFRKLHKLWETAKERKRMSFSPFIDRASKAQGNYSVRGWNRVVLFPGQHSFLLLCPAEGRRDVHSGSTP